MGRLFLLALVGLLGFSGADVAGRRKASKPPQFATMAEVLARLGKPDTIAYARLFDDFGVDQPGLELIYCKRGEKRFFVSTTGEVRRSSAERCTRRSKADRSKGQRETIADLYNRLGKPDSVLGKEHARDAVAQLTFKRQQEAYHIGRDGYAVAKITLPELPDDRGGKTVADVCRSLGRPNLIASAEEFQVKGEEGSQEPSVVMVYALFDQRRWYVGADGKVLAVHENKAPGPRWYPEAAEYSEEDMAGLMNRIGKPDVIAPVDRSSEVAGRVPRAEIVLSYERMNQRWYVSRDGLVVHCEPAPCK